MDMNYGGGTWEGGGWAGWSGVGGEWDNCNSIINKYIKKKKKKAFDKIQHFFMIKALNKVGIEVLSYKTKQLTHMLVT